MASATPAQNSLSGVFYDSSEGSYGSSEDESEGSNGPVSDISIDDSESSEESSLPGTPPRPATPVQIQPAVPAQPAERQFIAPNAPVWREELLPRTQAANVVNIQPGPINVDRDSSQLQLLELFLPVVMLQAILDRTNAFGRSKRGRQWKDIAMVELRSAIGLLLYLGLTKSGHQSTHSFWRPGMFSKPTCQATMSGTRFQDILTMLCFDDLGTRQQRRVADKFAPIREVFEMFTSNCRRYFSPGSCLTVDEQLVAFRGRCSFRQFVPSKPAKYGLKFWACVDSDSHYVCNLQPYIGKEGGSRETDLGASVVKDLVQPYYGTGRNVTCNNFFTSKDLAEHLLEQRMTIVGTIKGNRPEVPKEMRKESVRGREVKSSRFVFTNDMTLVSFVPRKNRNVTLLSTKHHDTAINPVNRKPYIIEYYNGTKAAVDTVDQMCSLYNCGRKTKRWPLVVFYNLINIAGINAYVLWLQLNPGWHLRDQSRRHAFLNEVIKGLVGPQIQMRADRPTGMRRTTTQAMTYLGYNVSYQHQLRHQPREPDTPAPVGPCHMCPRDPGGKRRRRTTRVCCQCHHFICAQHSQAEAAPPPEAICVDCIMAV